MVWRTQEIAHRIAIITSQNPCCGRQSWGTLSYCTNLALMEKSSGKPSAASWPQNSASKACKKKKWKKHPAKLDAGNKSCRLMRMNSLAAVSNKRTPVQLWSIMIWDCVAANGIGKISWVNGTNSRSKPPENLWEKKLNLIRINIIYLSQRVFLVQYDMTFSVFLSSLSQLIRLAVLS